MSTLHVAVVGAGIGGLAAAVALSRKGIDVSVHEQAHRLGEVGAGVGLSHNSLRLLDRVGLADRLRQTSTPLTGIQMRDRTGKLITCISYAGEEALLGLYRPDIIDTLADGLSDVMVSTGRRCVGFNQDDDHATVVFDTGERVVADVVIAADGIHSALQQFVVPPSDPVFSGSIAYRGVLPASRLPDHPTDAGIGWVGDGRHFNVYPPFHNGELINYGGIVPSDEAMRESWSLPGDPAVLASEFAGWDPKLQHIISQVDSTFRWGLYDRDPLPRWTNGRLTLLGDAAHPMLPHMGQGANSAVEDGFALATLLEGLSGGDAPEALLRYEALRKPRTAQMQLGGRANGALYDSADIADRGQEIGDAFGSIESYFDYDVEAEARALR